MKPIMNTKTIYLSLFFFLLLSANRNIFSSKKPTQLLTKPQPFSTEYQRSLNQMLNKLEKIKLQNIKKKIDHKERKRQKIEYNRKEITFTK